MITLSGVWYRPPGGAPTVRDVNLTLATGEFAALLGRSGSGKTSLVRLLNGLALPSCGSLQIDGLATADPEARVEARRRVGLILGEVDNQLLVGSVEEEVAFGPAGQGLPAGEVEGRVRSALTAVGLLHRAEEDPLALPLLDKYRLLIAAMLAQGVAYLIVDDIASLPLAEREELLALLAQHSQASDLGVLVAGPRRVDLARFRRLIGLVEGEIVYDGPPGGVSGDDELDRRLGLFVPQPASQVPQPCGTPEDDAVPPLLAWNEPSFARPLVMAGGEIVGILCDPGRATVLGEALAGLGKDETDQAVSVDGRRLGPGERRKFIALARGDHSQSLGRTVWEDVTYGPEAADEVGAASALAVAGLGDPAWRTRLPHSLSGGERSRLALAAALARRPRVVVLIEPFLGLDEASAADVVHSLGSWCRAEGAVALVLSAREDELFALLARVEAC